MKSRKGLLAFWQWGLALILVLALTGPAAAAPTWLQLNPTPDPNYSFPTPRWEPSAVYNPITNRLIVFGGTSGYNVLNDVWVLTNADGQGGTPAWTKLNPLAPNGAPAPRYAHAAVFDQANNRMIVHGGHTRPGYNEGHVGDTWILTNADGTGGDPTTWIPLSTTGPAPARRRHKAIYDAVNNRLVFGGGEDGSQTYDDVFVLTNANGLGGGSPAWTELYPAGALPTGPGFASFTARAAGYDPATETWIELAYYVVYQPPSESNPQRLLNLASPLTWTDLLLSGASPPLRGGYDTGVYDAGRNRMVIFGGNLQIPPGGLLNDVWRLEHANGQGGTPQWTQLNPAGTLPSPRYVSSAVYNPQADRMIVYGGYDSANLIDVWVLTEALGPPPNAPPVPNAGGSRSILSKDQAATVLQGTASDPEGDPLTYRWLEGTTELSPWQQVQNGQAPLNLGDLPFFSLGQHNLTLEVNDTHVTSRETMILTVENSAPNAGPTGGGTYQVNTPVTLAGEVSDFDGDQLTYQWQEGTTVLGEGVVLGIPGGEPVSLPSCIISNLPVAMHQITLQVSDGVNDPVCAGIKVDVIDTTPPTLAPVADKTILWPPNHQMVPITITTNARDNSGLAVALTAAVSCNEPNDGSVYWTQPVIDQATGVITLQLQASRLGKGSGRYYTIDITATDQSGNKSSAKAVIAVPHDQGKN